jgi:membrane protease YdiL (CAAX protease family)
MTLALVVVGVVGVGLGWMLIRHGHGSVWSVMGVLYAGLGSLALAADDIPLSPRVDPLTSTAVGAGAGLILHAATGLFLRAIRGWEAFQRDAREVYRRRRGRVPLPLALLIAVGVVAAGEELFWRGLVQARLADSVDEETAAFVGWMAYVVANMASWSLSIIAAAVVGGAFWAGLAVWSGGVLPAFLCHAVWTGLMLALPPIADSAGEASP